MATPSKQLSLNRPETYTSTDIISSLIQVYATDTAANSPAAYGVCRAG